MIDTSPLGQLCAQMMESIADRYVDPYEIRTCAIVVEIDSPKRSEFVVRCTDDRAWIIEAVLHEALGVIDEVRTPPVEDGHDG